jgi:hypothetical protein
MWYYRAAFFLDKRDVIGAWLICGAIATAFFGCPALTGALDSSTGDRHYATACRASALTAQPMPWSSRFRRSGRTASAMAACRQP